MEEIANRLGVVYAVTTADVNGDKRLDIVAINNSQLLWFENPSWAKHVIAEKVTEKDNVAVSPRDIDGDGSLDFALGGDWQATNTASGGALHWITSNGSAHKIGEEPTLHRIQWGDVGGPGPALVVAPLHGRGTKAPSWQGQGARILVYRIPKNPAKDPWPMEVASDSLHIVHNFIIVNREIWTASSEGIHATRRSRDGKWTTRLIGEGKPGEIKIGRTGGKRRLATVEPWHGNSIVVYTEGSSPWTRSVIESQLDQAHALGWADFDKDGGDELVAGWRGKPPGLALFRLQPDGSWRKTLIDDGVAVEDLTIADLNRDGRPDIVAGGRSTANLRIYWNERR